jgi:hypothetical protein
LGSDRRGRTELIDRRDCLPADATAEGGAAVAKIDRGNLRDILCVTGRSASQARESNGNEKKSIHKRRSLRE